MARYQAFPTPDFATLKAETSSLWTPVVHRGRTIGEDVESGDAERDVTRRDVRNGDAGRRRAALA
jgi:hypothetical protein